MTLRSKPFPTESSSDAVGHAPGAQSTALGLGSRLFRWLMPSVTDLLFVALLFGLSAGALGRILLRDADTGWHIRNGQQILMTHAIPRTDSFSASLDGKPWYAWEWLYDLLIAAVHQTLGLNGVVFYSAAVIAASFVVTFHFALGRGANLPITLFLLILALGASAVHFLARPHVVSWLLAVIWFEVVDCAVMTPSRKTYGRLFWLPALMLLWVNLHGGFLLGFVLLGAYLAGMGIQHFSEPERRTESAQVLKRLGVVTVLCAVASLGNPYGYKLQGHVYRYLTDRFLINRISEFLSPNFHSPAQQCFAFLIMITILALASARRRLHPAQILVVLFAVYGGLFATRNLPVGSLLLVLVVAPALSETMAAASASATVAGWMRGCCSWVVSFGSRMQRLETHFRGHLCLVAAFLAGLWACGHGGRLGSEQLINAYFDPQRLPVEAVELIEQRGIHQPIFSLDRWGGYLIYRLAPQTKVFIDDRHDFYEDALIKRYLNVTLAQPGWNEVLEEDHVNWVLMPPESPLANILRLTPQWQAVHEDSTAALFQRTEAR